jgi:WD40 repeat protein/serine/threonine protein kinase
MESRPSQPQPASDDRWTQAVALESLLAECLERLDADGERAVESLLSLHPQKADEIRGWLEAYRGWGLAGPTGGAAEASLPERLGEFRLLARLGRGGMGVVYLAQQEPLGREVALKLMRPEHLYFPGSRERFRREVEAVARLQHPGIVPIYTVGEEHGIPYFAMERVQGSSLAALLASLERSDPEKLTGRDLAKALLDLAARGGETPAAPRPSPAWDGNWSDAVFRIARQVGEALSHAHARGVLHRDVKPSNIMVTPDGRALLLDFGLAHLEGASRLTRTGTQLGSLPYMPPESLRGEVKDLGPRSDVYSLGVVLYELLTLRVPYFAESTEATRAGIIAGQAESVRARNRAVPWDAETICLTAMERDPARRYACAVDFARDIDNFLERRPIEARRPGPLLRARRWTERHPARSVAIAFGLLLFAGAVLFAVRQAAASRHSQGLRLLAESSSALRSDPGLALLLAIEGAERAPGLLARNALASALYACREERTLQGGSGGILAASWSVSGEWIAVASHDGKTRVWDARTGDLHALLEGHAAEVRAAAFNPSGDRVVTASADGTARLWSTASSVPPRILSGHSRAATMACFSPDGRRVLTASEDGTARVWEVEGGKAVLVLARHREGVHLAAAYSPDGRRIATGSYDRTACVWDASSGEKLLELGPLEGPGWSGIRSVAFSSDSRLLAAASLNGIAYVWDAGGGRLLWTFKGHEREIIAIAFDREGTRLATAAYDDTARVWDLATGGSLCLKGHAGRVYSASFSADGRKVLTVSEDTTARLWDAGTGRQLAVLLGHDEPVSSGCFSPDGKRAVTVSSTTCRIWDVASGALFLDLAAHDDAVSAVSVSRDGKRVATASSDHTACIWDAGTGALDARLRGHEAGLLGAEISPDGDRWLTTSRDLTARLWDARTRVATAVLRGHKLWIKAAAFSQDSQRTLTLSADSARVWDPARGEETASFFEEIGYELTAAEFHPDGDWIAIASTSGCVRMWNPGTRQVVVLQEALGRPMAAINSVAFARDGRRLLGSSDDGTAKVWDVVARKIAVTFRGHARPVRAAVFSRDARSARAVTASDDHTARVWDAVTGEAIAVLVGHKREVTSAAFSADGCLVLTVSRDMTVRLWDADTGEPGIVLGGGVRGFSCAAFAGGSTRLIVGASSGAARILEVLTDPLQTARRRRPRDLTPRERQQLGLGR